MNFEQRPRSATYANGTRRFAFVTLLMVDDSYLPGCLIVAHALQQQEVDADLICLVTPQVSRNAREALGLLYDRVMLVDPIHIAHARAQRRQFVNYMFTRLHALRLGSDGDLGCAYEKIVVLDSDILPLRRYQHLFTLPAPAGIINENKYHCIEVDENNRYVYPPDLQETGKWCWHRIYDPVCPHGHKIPSTITDRVNDDPSNLGINGGLLVLDPSMVEYRAIMSDLARPETKSLVGDKYTWPDMQYLTGRWSGQWTNVDLRFNALHAYPDLSVLFGTHYAGVKPWYFGRTRSVAHYAKFPDYQLWYGQWIQLVRQSCPELMKNKRLRRLTHQVEQAVQAE